MNEENVKGEKNLLTKEEAEAKTAVIMDVLKKNFFDVDDPLELYARTKGVIDILTDYLNDQKKDAVFAASAAAAKVYVAASARLIWAD